MTARLLLTPTQLRELLAPVLPWVAGDLAPEAYTLIRVVSTDGYVHALASNGASAACARVAVKAAPVVDFLMPASDAKRLAELREPHSVELEPMGTLLAVSITHGDRTMTLTEFPTRDPEVTPWLRLSDAVALAFRDHAAPAPSPSSRDLERLSRSLAVYRPGGSVAASWHTGMQGIVLAAHTDRFVAFLPSGSGSRDATSERVRHVGVTAGRGSTFTNPAEHWPGIFAGADL